MGTESRQFWMYRRRLAFFSCFPSATTLLAFVNVWGLYGDCCRVNIRTLYSDFIRFHPRKYLIDEFDEVKFKCIRKLFEFWDEDDRLIPWEFQTVMQSPLLGRVLSFASSHLLLCCVHARSFSSIKTKPSIRSLRQSSPLCPSWHSSRNKKLSDHLNDFRCQLVCEIAPQLVFCFDSCRYTYIHRRVAISLGDALYRSIVKRVT